jgi:hypothetical protein
MHVDQVLIYAPDYAGARTPEPLGAVRGAVENLIKSIQRRARHHFSIASVRHHFLSSLIVGVSEKSTEKVFLGNYWQAKLPLLLSWGGIILIIIK